MVRKVFLAAVALAALPASPQGFIDRMVRDQQAEWQKERLEALEKEPDARKRVDAAESLSGRNDPESLAALARALGDRDERVRAAAAGGLWRAGKAAAPHRDALLRALDDPDANVVAEAAGALQSQGLKRAELAAANRRVLEAPKASEASRFYAARALVDVESPPKLLRAMLDYLVRNAGGRSGKPTDAGRSNMALAAEAMQDLVKSTGDKGLLAPLADALGSAPLPAHPAILKAIGAYDPLPRGAAGVLVTALDAPDANVRYAALSQLRKVKDEREVALFVPRAAALLRDPDASVRGEALWALGGAGGLAAGEIDGAAAALKDAEASVRKSAARALGEIGDARQAIDAKSRARVAAVAGPALEAARDGDADRDVRDEAKAALVKLAATHGTSAAAAQPANASGEAAGLAVLRSRGVSFEETSFFLALRESDVTLVRAFLDAGMPVKREVTGMGSPLRAMLFGGPACSVRERPTKPATVATIRLLLERGVDPNQADANGNTALMEAASKGCDREVMRMLVKAGANVNAKNAMGITPFEMGLWNAHDGLDEIIAGGFRLPPAKAKDLAAAYKDKPASLAYVKKASGGR